MSSEKNITRILQKKLLLRSQRKRKLSPRALPTLPPSSTTSHKQLNLHGAIEPRSDTIDRVNRLNSHALSEYGS